MSHQSMSFLEAESREKDVEKSERQASSVPLSLNLGIQIRLENSKETNILVRKLCDIECYMSRCWTSFNG